ncbi:hypothetical protein AN958_08561 [Leucoagaricus sp. SymC.cos]|nr:hypothetical protein AN958_08561 [Leucoagaricus sp. SymC.cos]
MPIPLPQSVAVSFTGGLAFGIYFATLLICLRWLLFGDQGWKFKKTIRWGILVVTFLIFASNVVYLAMSLHGTMQTAAHPADPSFHTPGWIGIVACTAANCNVLLADMVLIYRCWLIYERQYYTIAVPIFLWFAAFVCTVLQIYLQTEHLSNPKIGPYTWASVNMTWGPGIVLLPFWISTVVLNAYSAAVLIRRIYRAAEDFHPHSSAKHLHFLIRVIAESGLLYLSVTLAHLLIWFGKSDMAINMIGILNAPIVGIAFNWFLIRLERNKAKITAETSGRPNLSTNHFSKTSQHAMAETSSSAALTDTTLQIRPSDTRNLSAAAGEASPP